MVSPQALVKDYMADPIVKDYGSDEGTSLVTAMVAVLQRTKGSAYIWGRRKVDVDLQFTKAVAKEKLVRDIVVCHPTWYWVLMR